MENKDVSDKSGGSAVEPNKEITEKSDIGQNNVNSKPMEESNVDAKTIENEKEESKIEENMENNLSEFEDPKITFHRISLEVDQFVMSASMLRKDDKDDAPEFVDKFLDLAEEMVAKYEFLGDGNTKWGQEPEEESSFLESLDRISKLYRSLVDVKLVDNGGLLINRIGIIQHRAMAYLEDEFRILMGEFKPIGDTDQCTENQEDLFLGYPEKVLFNLSQIAKEMISSGYDSECFEAYLLVRRYALDEIMKRLGFEKHNIEDVYKMDSDSLNREIVSWITTFKECISIYYPGELKLAGIVFVNNPQISTTIFNNLTGKLVLQFLNTVDGIIMTKRSPEKLFKTLDVYETLRNVTPKVDELFVEKGANELKIEILTTRSRLGEVAILLFSELESVIRSDANRSLVPGGAIHPLTRYTMNYLEYLSAYKDTLEQIFKEHSKIERRDSTSTPHHDNYENEGHTSRISENEAQSQVSIQLMRVMDLLDANLEGKAKLYKDSSLTSIFLMNNGRYILQKIKGCLEIYSLMGENWCRKRSSNLRQYHKNYQRETWGKLLNCLSHEGLSSHGKVMKPLLKERFKAFNAIFDEIHKTQSAWVVSDEQLQSELRVSISAVVIPAYRSFLARFAQTFDPGRQTEKYIKFQAEDIESYIDDLFEGKNPTSSMVRKIL